MKNKKICLNRSFGIQPGAENYDTYVKFVHDVLNTTYLNLASLAKYKGIKDFENANFLEIAREMESLIPLVGPKYLRVMTEVIENVRCNFFLLIISFIPPQHGLCQSSSFYSCYQSPYAKS